jgi:hypothetical protein
MSTFELFMSDLKQEPNKDIVSRFSYLNESIVIALSAVKVNKETASELLTFFESYKVQDLAKKFEHFSFIIKSLKRDITEAKEVIVNEESKIMQALAIAPLTSEELDKIFIDVTESIRVIIFYNDGLNLLLNLSTSIQEKLLT